MPSREEQRRRKEVVKTEIVQQKAVAEAQIPLSKRDLLDLCNWVDKKLENGYDQTLRYTRAFLNARNLPEDAILSWLEEYGGHCDCEVIANVADTWRDGEWHLC